MTAATCVNPLHTSPNQQAVILPAQSPLSAVDLSATQNPLSASNLSSGTLLSITQSSVTEVVSQTESGRSCTPTSGAMASSAAVASAASATAHCFVKKTFHKPVYCHHCTDLLWGIMGQGYTCEGLCYCCYPVCYSCYCAL